MSRRSRRKAQRVEAARAVTPLTATDDRPEPWGWFALALAGATLLCWGLLGSRLSPRTSIWLYGEGRFHLVFVALLTAAAGFGAALRRRPLLQRRRLWPGVALAFTIGIAPFPVPYPSSREGIPCTIPLELPVRGEWRVRWGGEGVENNPLVLDAARRYSLVLVAPAPPSAASGPEDWPAFGAPVHAPADGVVVQVEEGLPDPATSGSGHPLGNRLVLQLATGELLWLTGLRKDSVLPEVGDEVTAGQAVAQVGWSAAPRPTGEPHLGLHLTTALEPAEAEGVPFLLAPYLRGGAPAEGTPPAGGVDWDGRPRGPLVAPGTP